MQLTRIEKAQLSILQDRLKEAVETFTKEFGLDVHYNGCRYDTLTYEPKLVFKVKVTADGKSAERAEFDRNATYFNVPKTAYNKTFTLRGMTYKLVGFNLRRSKYCVKGRRVTDDKVFLFPRTVLTLGLGIK